MIVGITGPIGHGKTALAESFKNAQPKSELFESGEIIAEVANGLHRELAKQPELDGLQSVNNWLESLPKILNKTVRVRPEFKAIKIYKVELFAEPAKYDKLFAHLVNIKANPSIAEELITADNKARHRPFLQWLGGYLVEKVGPGIWYDELVRRAVDASDKGIKLCIISGVRYPTDAEIIHQANGTVIKIIRPALYERDAADPTENQRSKIKADTTVINNGSLADLQACAGRLLTDLNDKKLKINYSTKKNLVVILC